MNNQSSVVEPKHDEYKWGSIVHGKLLKADDVRDILGISRSQTYSLMKRGAIYS